MIDRDLKHMDTHVRCPHCHRDMARKPYVMSTRQDKPLIEPLKAVAWLFVIVLVLVALSRLGG